MTQTDNCKAKAGKTPFGVGLKAQFYPTIKQLAKKSRRVSKWDNRELNVPCGTKTLQQQAGPVKRLHPSGGGTLVPAEIL